VPPDAEIAEAGLQGRRTLEAWFVTSSRYRSMLMKLFLSQTMFT